MKKGSRSHAANVSTRASHINVSVSPPLLIDNIVCVWVWVVCSMCVCVSHYSCKGFQYLIHFLSLELKLKLHELIFNPLLLLFNSM